MNNIENKNERTMKLEELINNMNILYEDNHIIVVEKYRAIPVQQDKTNDIDMLTIIKEYIRIKYNKQNNVYLGLVHRLDRPVSGVMVFAKTSKAASRLSDAIRRKDFDKQYLAVVNGKFEKTEGQMKDYLWKNQKDNMSYIVREGKKNAKEAILNYKVISYNKEENLSLVSVQLITGRHHQIRVQFSGRGHALYGDIKYHGRVGKNTLTNLYAYSLSFTHPVTKEKLYFKNLPNMELEKWNVFKDIKLENI